MTNHLTTGLDHLRSAAADLKLLFEAPYELTDMQKTQVMKDLKRIHLMILRLSKLKTGSERRRQKKLSD